MIEERILEKLTVEHLADSVHFSKYHYQRMFHKIAGESVMSYVTKRKLSLAGRELLDTHASILDVALKYGYDSHEGFTRSFKAYMGVSPADYRKYGLSAIFQKNLKEGANMLYSKTTDAIIRELNDLIAQMKTVAAYTRKNYGNGGAGNEIPFWKSFWEFIANKEDAMAEELKRTMEQVTAIAQRPDEISIRFLLVKVIEDTAFQSDFTAFNVGLMISRARPEQREEFGPICDKYDELAEKARIKTEKLTAFFNELTTMIFQDMRESVRQKLHATVEKGSAAVEHLKSSADVPYAYLTEEIMAIVNDLSSLRPEDITVSHMEDVLLHLQMVSFAADMDLFRVPAWKEMFSGIWAFAESLEEMTEFLRSLPEAASETFAAPETKSFEHTRQKRYSDLALQGNVLLFYTRGEIQKLGEVHLHENQKAAFDAICRKISRAIELARGAEDETAFHNIADLLSQVQQEMRVEADRLGVYGNAIRFLADKTAQLALAAGQP